MSAPKVVPERCVDHPDLHHALNVPCACGRGVALLSGVGGRPPGLYLRRGEVQSELHRGRRRAGRCWSRPWFVVVELTTDRAGGTRPAKPPPVDRTAVIGHRRGPWPWLYRPLSRWRRLECGSKACCRFVRANAPLAHCRQDYRYRTCVAGRRPLLPRKPRRPGEPWPVTTPFGAVGTVAVLVQAALLTVVAWPPCQRRELLASQACQTPPCTASASGRAAR